MAFKCIQLTLDAETPTPTIVRGTGDGQFVNAFGTVTDPIPVSIKNEDEADVVWWGGPDVTDLIGQSIPPGGIIVMNLYGESEIPYVYSDGTPIVSVLLGRQ
jgi:hypothetical protein